MEGSTTRRHCSGSPVWMGPREDLIRERKQIYSIVAAERRDLGLLSP